MPSPRFTKAPPEVVAAFDRRFQEPELVGESTRLLVAASGAS